MKLLRTLGLIATCSCALLLCSCSSKGFDAEASKSLCEKYDTNQPLTYDDYSQMIQQEQWAFDSLQKQMQQLLEIADKGKFEAKYQELRADTDFMAMYELSERLWKILVLNQSGFSEDNRQEFSDLFNQRKIIDLLDDDIQHRLNN